MLSLVSLMNCLCSQISYLISLAVVAVPVKWSKDQYLAHRICNLSVTVWLEKLHPCLNLSYKTAVKEPQVTVCP